MEDCMRVPQGPEESSNGQNKKGTKKNVVEGQMHLAENTIKQEFKSFWIQSTAIYMADPKSSALWAFNMSAAKSTIIVCSTCLLRIRQ